MTTCERCGDLVENKDNRGWFRDKFWSCIKEVADQETSHRETCEDADCVVCAAS